MAKRDVMRAVRDKCLDCSGGLPSEVRYCPVESCALYRFRFGKDPTAAKGPRIKTEEDDDNGHA